MRDEAEARSWMVLYSSLIKWLYEQQFHFEVSVQSLSRVWLFVTPWTAACQVSLSITNCWSLPKPMPIELAMPSNHLILCRPLLLLPSIFPSISVFSNESPLHIRWPKYWCFTFNITLSNEHPGLISFRMDLQITLNTKWLNKLSNVHFRQNILSAVWEGLEGRCVRLVLGLKKWWSSELKTGLKSSQRITLIALRDKQNDLGFWLGQLGRAYSFKRNGEDKKRVTVKEEKKISLR